MRARLLYALLTAGSVAILACGSDGDDGTTSADAGTAVFTVKEATKEESVLEGPDTVEAGAVQITLENRGKRFHDLQMVKVEGDRTPDEVVAQVFERTEPGPIADWVTAAGGISWVAPGEQATVTQVLSPGTYYLADQKESDIEHLNPKVRASEGIRELTVTGETDAELPDTDASIVAREYEFETTGIQSGKNRLTFENDGAESHTVTAVKLDGQTTFDEVRASPFSWLPTGPTDRSLAVLGAGESQIAEMDFERGAYALLCFAPDKAGQAFHAAQGMVSKLVVP